MICGNDDRPGWLYVILGGLIVGLITWVVLTIVKGERVRREEQLECCQEQCNEKLEYSKQEKDVKAINLKHCLRLCYHEYTGEDNDDDDY